ncbi:MAG TPA: hypothetical protein VFM96_01680 [Gaiellaceae bacterium]|nr:hypothetical protein [Gaiellaceae bacterium]
MRRYYGLYDATRGLTTLAAGGIAGLLLWAATRVGQQTDGRYWAGLAIVAGAGLVLALSQLVGNWTKGLRVRISPGTLAFGLLPVIVCVGWILLAGQPGNGWEEGRIVSWTGSIGLTGIVHDLALWQGVLAFGLGLVLGLSLDAVPEGMVATDVDRPTGVIAAPGPVDRRAADEPLAAERRAAHDAEPNTVTVGPKSED